MPPSGTVDAAAQLCRHFRARNMYVPGNEASSVPGDVQEIVSHYCWCNKTMTELGLDDDVVGRERCASPSRRCYHAF